MIASTLIQREHPSASASDLCTTVGVDKVKDDYSTLTGYVVDASIYRIVQKAVALAEFEEDIAARVRYAVP